MGRLKNIVPIAVLAGLCGLIFLSRLHTYDEPLDRDLTTYAVIAHEMLAGKALYRDLWDHKPPAIHVTYAAAELIAGYGRDAIFLMNIAAAFVTLFACYWAGSAGGGGRAGGCFAAALWALTSGNLGLEGNQPNTEVFLNAGLAAAFAILVRAEKSNLAMRGALMVGALFALASLYKQVVAVQAVMLAVAYWACCQDSVRRRAVVDVAIIGLTGIAVWASVFVYFFARGSGPAFTEAVFSYNRYYATDVCRHDLGNGQSWSGIPLATVGVLLSMAILAIVGLANGLIFGPRRKWILLAAFAVATQIAVLLPGWFFRHYYQLWLPPLAIGTGWAAALFKRVLPERLPSFSYSVGAVACSIVILLQVPDYLIPAKAWSFQKYGGIFLSTDQLAGTIDNLMLPGETFYEWGNESGLYFTTGRRPPSGIVFAFPMLAGPLKEKLSWRLIGDLSRAKPDLIIVDVATMTLTQRDHPVLNWFDENYKTFARADDFLLLARKGSRLDNHAVVSRPTDVDPAQTGLRFGHHLHAFGAQLSDSK